MRSATPKVLHPVCGRPLVEHVIDTAQHIGADEIVLVVFHARALGIGSETDEATEVRAFAVSELPWDELAFWSTTAALRDALAFDGG